MAPGSTTLTPVPEIEQGATIPKDGVAPLGSDRFVVITTAKGEAQAVAYRADTGYLTAGPFRLRMEASGVVSLWPYAYFGSDQGLYHVDLQSGLLERMVKLDHPSVLAVAAR
jgi:hypothetical protein